MSTVTAGDVNIASEILRQPILQLDSGGMIPQSEFEIVRSILEPPPPTPTPARSTATAGSSHAMSVPANSHPQFAPVGTGNTQIGGGLIDYYTANPGQIQPAQPVTNIAVQPPQMIPPGYANKPSPFPPWLVATLAGMGCFTILVLMILMKLWGTTDIGQQQAWQQQQSAYMRQSQETNERVIEAAEEVGQKREVCISFYCGDRTQRSNSSRSDSGRSSTPTAPTATPQARQVVRAWVDANPSVTYQDLESYVAWAQQSPQEARSQGLPPASELYAAVQELK